MGDPDYRPQAEGGLSVLAAGGDSVRDHDARGVSIDTPLRREVTIIGMPPAPWVNPFTNFLETADSKLRNIKPMSMFDLQLIEDRSFVFDIVHRVRALSTAFDRLRELYELDDKAGEPRRKAQAASAAADHAAVEVPGNVTGDPKRYHLEAVSLGMFVGYELSTLVVLLRGLNGFTLSRGSSMEYLYGVRNKLLSHSRRDARIKDSMQSLTSGPILYANLVGGSCFVESVRDEYRKQLTHKLDDEAGKRANEKLIRSRTRVDEFTAEQKLQLKAYSIPEPDLARSAEDMVTMLDKYFLPELNRVCSAR